MDRRLTQLAERQHGLFTLAQVRQAGGTGDAAWRRLGNGRWQPVGEGVYRLTGAPRTWEQQVMGVVLTAGPDAAASHRSAAALLGIPGFGRAGPPEVTTPRARRHRRSDAIVHRWRPFPDHHLTVVEGIPCTRVARTLVDLAGVVHPARTERAIDNCLASGAVAVEALLATTIELAKRGRSGIAVMRRLLDARSDGYVAPESALEARFLDAVREAGLPEPVRQLDVGDQSGWVGRIDFAWPSARLVVEVDGRRHHSAELDLESDRVRDNRLVAAGWRVARVRWHDLDSPEAIVAMLRRLLTLGVA